jgi:uncharacterized caspase-like protein
MRKESRFLGILTFLFVLALTIGNAAAMEGERHALVIGNSSYVKHPLINPLNDANDIAEQLSLLGYKVYGGQPALDLDRIGIERTIRAFAQQLPEQANALFYYAGHGIAYEQDNYLVPVRHNLEFQEQLPDRAVSLRSLVNLLKTSNPEGTNVFLLDACSDNPLTSSFRSIRQGLNRLYDIPRGSFIGYAADVGQVAADGQGRNGTYTSELLSIMRDRPNTIIELAHKEVAERVLERTDGDQFPVSENKVYGDWCFGDCAEPIATTTPTDDLTETDAEIAQPATTSSNRRWMILGGVLLTGIIAAAVGDSDDPGTGNSVTVTTPLP